MDLAHTRDFEKDIANIYELTEHQDWQGLLALMIDITGSNSGALILEYVDDSTPIEVDILGISDALLPEYVGQYAKMDPWTEKFNDLERGTSTFVAGDEILSLDQYKQTEFYQQWGNRANMAHACGSYFSLRQGRAFKLGIQRDEEKGPYFDEIPYLNKLRPHLERAIEFASLLKRQSQQRMLLDESLSMMGFAAFWCDFKRNIVAKNKLADDYLTSGNVVQQSEDGTLQSPLVDLVTICENSRLTRLGKANSPLINSIEASGAEYELMIDTRLSGDPEGADHQPGYLVLVRKLNEITSAQLTANFSQFTEAEAQICAALCNGMSLGQASDYLSKSNNTLKTQVKSACQKLDVSSQFELVSKLLSNLL